MKIPTLAGLNTVAFAEGSFWVCGLNGVILQSDSADGLPRLIGTTLPDSNSFQLGVVLNVPPVFRIQASATLQPNSWQDLVAVTNSVSPFVWTDSNLGGNPSRFYRVVTP